MTGLRARQKAFRHERILESAADLFRKAGYEADPRHDGSLRDYQIIEVPLTSLNREALKNIEGLSTKEKDRSQNFFALGLAFWMFDRPLDVTIDWINKKFAKTPPILEGNIRALETGYHFGETSRIFQHRYRIRPASLPAGPRHAWSSPTTVPSVPRCSSKCVRWIWPTACSSPAGSTPPRSRFGMPTRAGT